jgi:hypothetical protein
MEIAAIAVFRTSDHRFGYNLGPGGDLSASTRPEIAKKISAALKGIKKTPEHIAAAQATKKARGPTAKQLEALARMSAANIGRPSPRKGAKHSIEARLKMSASRKGVPRGPYTDGRGAKISAALKGRPNPFKGKHYQKKT